MSENPASSSEPLNFASGAAPSKDDTNLATLIYVLCIFTGFIGPLIIWLMKKEQSSFVDDQGKEVLNWCITMVLAYFVCFLLMFIIIGIFLMPILAIAHIVLTIMGAMKVNKGIAYRYPFAIRLLK